MYCLLFLGTFIKCLKILWKLFSEIYFKIPSVFILKLEFPALHREWHKSGRSCICKWKMPQGLHPSFFHSFKVKINLTKMELHVAYMQMENATGPPLHHAGYSFKVKIKCGKDGSVDFSFITVIYKGDDTNSFFLKIQLHANGLVRCKEGSLEQHFLYEVRNYA